MSRVARGRRSARRLAILFLAVAAGCVDPVAPCAKPSRFAGTWSYAARQTSPTSASITGTLVLKTSACGRVVGSLDVIARDAAGSYDRLAGDVQGAEVDTTTVSFDAYLGDETREHLARFAGDSLVGTWLDVASGGASGAFSARR